MSSRATTAAGLFIALLPTWYMLGGPPLTASSDGRYAAVAEQMARTGDWLVPRYGERAHLTKPGLTYWAEAASIELFGANEFAVRLPSALAMTIVVIGVFFLGRRVGGRGFGLIASMLVGVMPLPVIVGRLTLTDGLLAPCWFGVLAGGWLAIREPGRRRGSALLWSAAAVGWLVKGPIVLIPLLPLAAWRGFAGRWGELRRLRPAIGLPLSLVPIAAWAAVVWSTVPGAAGVWEHEVLGRAAGGGNHPQPFWFFIPVFLAGLFPATAMLPLPGLNLPWRRAWAALREGSDGALWSLAIVVPLVVFSLPSGKLPAYITPLAPAAAFLAAGVLSRWLDGVYDARGVDEKPPDVRYTLLAVSVLIVVVGAGAGWVALGPRFALLVLPAAGLVGLAVGLCRRWSAGPAARRGPLAGLWLGGAAGWLWGLTLWTLLTQPYGARQLEAFASSFARAEPARLVTFDHTHYALSFYARRHVPRIDGAEGLAEAAARGRSVVVISEAGDWRTFAKRSPAAAGAWGVRAEFSQWPRRGSWYILVPEAAGDAR